MRHGPVAAARPPATAQDLTIFEARVFSQNGEDGVIEEVMRRIGVGSSVFVEFGIESGIEGNCVFLAEVLGWKGLFIESDPEHFARLATRYRDRPGVVTTQAEATPENINDLIAAAGIGGEIDVLSIDIDSHDYWVWKAISVVRPRLVVIEYNAHTPFPERLVQPLSEPGPWRRTDYFGASLGALEALATDLGYRLVHTDLAGVNAFFVSSEKGDAFPAAECVPRRSPNYFLMGHGHPADSTGRSMVDPQQA